MERRLTGQDGAVMRVCCRGMQSDLYAVGLRSVWQEMGNKDEKLKAIKPF